MNAIHDKIVRFFLNGFAHNVEKLLCSTIILEPIIFMIFSFYYVGQFLKDYMDEQYDSDHGMELLHYFVVLVLLIIYVQIYFLVVSLTMFYIEYQTQYFVMDYIYLRL